MTKIVKVRVHTVAEVREKVRKRYPGYVIRAINLVKEGLNTYEVRLSKYRKGLHL